MAVHRIRTVNLYRRYKNITAVADLNLVIHPGEVFCFLGPNGAGKSTTIKMLTGILRPSSGQVHINGIDMLKNSPQAKGAIGYVPEEPFLYDKLTGMEMLQVHGRLYGLNSTYIRQQGSSLLDRFGLLEAHNRLVGEYSHGMKQRLMFSMALLHDPDILIVDEPLVGLDPAGAKLVKNLLLNAARDEGKTVFMSTHTLSVAEEVGDTVGIIHKGAMIACDTIDTLKRQYDLEHQTLESLFLQITSGRG